MTLEEVVYNIQSIAEIKGEVKDLSLNQFNYYLKNASLELWRKKFGYVKDEEGFETKRQISDVMKRYVSDPTSIALATGVGTLPAEYVHCVAIYYISGSDKINIDLVTGETFYQRVDNGVTLPTTTYPVAYVRNNTKIYVEPTSITPIYMVYVSRPTTPALAMKKENGVMVYDSANSDELDWDEEYHWDIIKIMLGYIGISVNDQFLTSYIEGKLEQQN
jgi:hypothetical protein